MHFNEAMQQLADRIGFDGLRPDPRGEYSLVFDDDLKVRCAPIGKSLRARCGWWCWPWGRAARCSTLATCPSSLEENTRNRSITP